MSDYQLLIGGRLVAGEARMDVINPATEEVIASCARASNPQLEAAVAAAKAAFPEWARASLDERKRVLTAIAAAIDANADALARLLTLEQGKPLSDASAEVRHTAAFFRYFATLELPVRVVTGKGGQRTEVHRRPLGVVAAIIPWNFPLLIIAFKVPAALLAGNTVVLKPAATTPLATLELARLIAQIVPPGVINVVADANDLGAALSSHPDVRKVSLTGSTATGRKVMGGAAQTLKRLTLELGGNDAGIVLDDVDPAAVASRIFDGAFQNNGQVCLALKRLYVHSSIYDRMCDELTAIAERTVVGDGMSSGTRLGPLQNRMQYERVATLVQDAAKHGATIKGGPIEGRGYFFRPTIVRDIDDGARLVDEEQFGPVLPVIRYSDDEDALRRANSSAYGLGGSVWSADPERAYALAARLEAGTVWINTHMGINPDVPFGGAKQSGVGVEFGLDGLLEYTQLQVITRPS
jgi:acyl-CoA reductase-like NAD-dependent aldehyde dehydrogenase